MSSASWWVTNGRGEAAAGDVLQDRRLDLGEPAGVQGPAQRRQDLRPRAHDLSALEVRRQVQVALAVAGLGVAQAVPLLGHRAQRLREQDHAVGLDADLALLRLHDDAARADDVAQVELLVELGQPVRAERVGGEEELEVSRRGPGSRRTRASRGCGTSPAGRRRNGAPPSRHRPPASRTPPGRRTRRRPSGTRARTARRLSPGARRASGGGPSGRLGGRREGAFLRHSSWPTFFSKMRLRPSRVSHGS